MSKMSWRAEIERTINIWGISLVTSQCKRIHWDPYCAPSVSHDKTGHIISL